MNIAVHPAELIQKFLLKFSNTYYRSSEKEKQQRFAQNVKAVFQGTLNHIFTQVQKSSVSQPLSQARVGTLVFWVENQQTQLGIFLEKTATHFRVYPINSTNLLFQSAELTTNQVQILGCFPPSFLSEELTGNFTSDISYPTPPGFKMYYVANTSAIVDEGTKEVIGVDDAFLALTGQSSERQWFIDAWNLLRQTSLGEDLYQRFTTNNPQSGQPEDIVFLCLSEKSYTSYGTTYPCISNEVDGFGNKINIDNKPNGISTIKYNQTPIFNDVEVTNHLGKRIHLVEFHKKVILNLSAQTKSSFESIDAQGDPTMRNALQNRLHDIEVQKLAETIYHELRYHIDWDPNNNMINVPDVEKPNTPRKGYKFDEHDVCGDNDGEHPFYQGEFNGVINDAKGVSGYLSDWFDDLNNNILPFFDNPTTQKLIKDYNKKFGIAESVTETFLIAFRNKIITQGNHAFKSQLYNL
ncbi:MAG: hypothetical protein ACKVTZ_18360, partial [Bacteroidia bacterium]